MRHSSGLGRIGVNTPRSYETAEKEVQDTSCLGSGVFPRLKKFPKIGGLGGCLRLFSAVSIYIAINARLDLSFSL